MDKLIDYTVPATEYSLIKHKIIENNATQHRDFVIETVKQYSMFSSIVEAATAAMKMGVKCPTMNSNEVITLGNLLNPE